MNEFNITEYIALKTMTLKSETSCLSFIHTIWRDRPVLILFNNLTSTITEVMLNPTLQEGDEAALTKLVKAFLV